MQALTGQINTGLAVAGVASDVGGYVFLSPCFLL